MHRPDRGGFSGSEGEGGFAAGVPVVNVLVAVVLALASWCPSLSEV